MSYAKNINEFLQKNHRRHWSRHHRRSTDCTNDRKTWRNTHHHPLRNETSRVPHEICGYTHKLCRKKHAVTKNSIKDGVILIGVGLSRNVDGTYSGDFDGLEVKKKNILVYAHARGVGPVIVACLMKNLVMGYTRSTGGTNIWNRRFRLSFYFSGKLCIFKYVSPLPLSISLVSTQKPDSLRSPGEGKVSTSPDMALLSAWESR